MNKSAMNRQSGGDSRTPGDPPSRSPELEEIQDAGYRIGAVARLTGLSAHTLRKWEHRYGLVRPARTAAGDRLYSRSDLRRLALTKCLVDGGMAIGRVARLSVEALEAACAQERGSAVRATGGLRVAVFGDALPALLGPNDACFDVVEPVAARGSPDSPRARVDVVLYECPIVGAGTGATVQGLVQRLGALGAVLVYGFGSRPNLAAVRAPNVALMRAPVDTDGLQRAALGMTYTLCMPAGSPPGGGEEQPARRLGADGLARVAASSPRVECECPRHLAELVRSLGAFESYSAECAVEHPGDAVLHRYLHATAARARALFEEALIRVARAEGIDLDG